MAGGVGADGGSEWPFAACGVPRGFPGLADRVVTLGVIVVALRVSKLVTSTILARVCELERACARRFQRAPADAAKPKSRKVRQLIKDERGPLQGAGNKAYHVLLDRH